MRDAAPIVVIAPDSLKGTCSSPDAARALAAGARSVLGDAADIRELPMADGGEGTLEALVSAWGGRLDTAATTDALGRPRTGRIGYGSGSGAGSGEPRLRAIVEAADANGLPAVSDQPLRALDADTAGVGVLILAALDAGAGEILLCIGGSATSDGGAGMLRALGVRLLDRAGGDVAPGARGLADLHSIDTTGIDRRAAAARWRIACDVDNPLTGHRGAAAVFGPQKGADAADVTAIDRGLARLAALLAEEAGLDEHAAAALASRPGMGAAGGLALGPVALFAAELVPGARLVAEAIGLREALEGAALAITGEGRLDAQSLDGKVVSQLLADVEANARETTGAPRTPVVVIAGLVELSQARIREAGIAEAVALAGPGSAVERGSAATLDELRERTPRLLAEAAARVCRSRLGGVA